MPAVRRDADPDGGRRRFGTGDPLQNLPLVEGDAEEVTVDEPTSAEWVIGEWVTLDRELHPFEALELATVIEAVKLHVLHGWPRWWAWTFASLVAEIALRWPFEGRKGGTDPDTLQVRIPPRRPERGARRFTRERLREYGGGAEPRRDCERCDHVRQTRHQTLHCEPP